MMLPLVRVPPTITNQLTEYRDLFCRDAGFEQVSRYVAGLLLTQGFLRLISGKCGFSACVIELFEAIKTVTRHTHHFNARCRREGYLRSVGSSAAGDWERS
jgi:hypothetical protein